MSKTFKSINKTKKINTSCLYGTTNNEELSLSIKIKISTSIEFFRIRNKISASTKKTIDGGTIVCKNLFNYLYHIHFFLKDTSSQGDLFFSPDVQSQENQTHRSNQWVILFLNNRIWIIFVISVQARLSPSLPPSSTITTNKQFLLTPFLQRNTNEM